MVAVGSDSYPMDSAVDCEFLALQLIAAEKIF